MWCQRRYGKCFTLRYASLGPCVYVADPADIRAMFRDPDTFRGGEPLSSFAQKLIGPESVLATDGAVHRRQRRLMTPAFYGDPVSALATLMADVVASHIEAWPVGVAFPAWPRMREITFEVILRAVTGVDDEQRLAGLRDIRPPLLDRNRVALVVAFTAPKLADRWVWPRFRAIEQRANAALFTEIDRCIDSPELDQRKDVLAMLVRARGEDGAAFTRDELRDQVVTLVVAGHETTAAALAWALERLVRHPQILARAQRAARDGDDQYLDAIVTETLRVRPVVTFFPRNLFRPAEVGGYLLPAGTTVIPAIILVQRAAEHYPRPLVFDPDRFVGQAPDPALWLPFGGGNRRCLGAAFASVQMRVVLREILRRVELQTTTSPGERPKMRAFMMAPGKDARITVRRRLPAGRDS